MLVFAALGLRVPGIEFRVQGQGFGSNRALLLGSGNLRALDGGEILKDL